MTYLTPAQVLFIHARLIAETGGTQGIRDLGLLAMRPFVSGLTSGAIKM